jgi:hypothetical protein
MTGDPSRGPIAVGGNPPGSRATGGGIDLLRRVEEDLSIFDPAVGGYSLWPALRFPAWQLVSGVKTGAPGGRGWTLARRAGWLLGLATYGAWSLLERRRLRARRFDLLFLTVEAHRSVRRAGAWWDPYLDEVAAHPALAGRVLRLERRDFAVSRRRTVQRRHLFTDLQLVDRVRRRGSAPPAEVLDAAAHTCERFYAKLREAGAPVDAGAERSFRARALAIARRFHDERTWYEELLADFQPKVVALVDAYHQHGLVAAARSRRVPVVEFQHGSIHADHPGYIWPGSARGVRDALAVPDRIATYGAYWSDVLTRDGFWKPAEVPAVGSARIDGIRRAARRGDRAVARIVFTSQFATRGQTLPLLKEFIGLAGREGLEYELVVKVHRAERDRMADYRALAGGSRRVTVLSPYHDDTLELIAGADIHVSGWSTCHYEAIALGTPTIVLTFPGPDRVAGLSGFSSVFRASSARELLECVTRARNERGNDGAKRREESARLFQPGAVENGVALLQACISGSGPPA